MLLGLNLLWVGAVLFLNGVWLLGKIDDKEISIINIFVGGLSLIVALTIALNAQATLDAIQAGAFTLLFSLTYLWVAFGRYNGADGRGLGWYSLFVSITAIPIAISTFQDAATVWDFWFGVCWASWCILWFMYFLLLALRKPIQKITGWTTLIMGIYTGWIPGYLLLDGILH